MSGVSGVDSAAGSSGIIYRLVSQVSNDAWASKFSAAVERMSLSKWLSKLRPFSELTQGHYFNRPKSLEDAFTRLEINLKYFMVNYAVAMCLLVLISVLTIPWLFTVTILSVVFWIYMSSKENLKLGNYVLNGRDKTRFTALIIAGAMLLTAGTTFFLVIGFGAIFVLIHAFLHESMLDPELENLGSELTGTVEEDPNQAV